MVARRDVLSGMAASVFLGGFPVAGMAQGQRADLGKIGVIILEGGLDGLTAVPAIGDPGLRKQRKGLVSANPIKLNPFFGLHPNLSNYSQMLAHNEAVVVHATSIPYTLRSHFEGQNLMEGGGAEPFEMASGWLGRAMDIAGIPGKSLAIDMPLLIRGGSDLDNLYPANIQGSRPASADLLELLRANRPEQVAASFDKLHIKQLNREIEAVSRDAEGLSLAAGQQLAKPGGPSVAVIRITEFDTHASQGVDDGRHPDLLRKLDGVFAAFKKGLGTAWSQTVILTLTEFGRTVRENGSEGTDHGYGTAGLLAGGLIKTGNVIADWPGLGDSELFEGRDLMATLDYRAVCAACIERAFGLDHGEVVDRVFFDKSIPRVHDLIFG